MIIISLNMIRIEWARLVGVAFSRSNVGARRKILAVDSPSIRTRSISVTTTATARLKREDCRHIKFDSAFSKWKLLVRHSDWEDHSTGKEGAEKYRTQNLPDCTCPGNYELGILLPVPGRESRDLDPSSVIPVYVGEADNVRARIQKHGRDGAHLENGRPNGPGLFSQIFLRGLSLVYRWAPMKGKKDAEGTEDQLLATYDYAWNKRGNVDRRPDDIHRKLESRAKKSNSSVLHTILDQYFLQKQLVGKIETGDPFRDNSGTGVMDGNGISSKVFAVWRRRLGRVQSGRGDDRTGICGVAIGDGCVCTEPPAKGRKRCPEHKGMKINTVISKF